MLQSESHSEEPKEVRCRETETPLSQTALSVTAEIGSAPAPSPEPCPTSGSVPGPASQLTDKASLKYQLNQEPAHFCTDSCVEWGQASVPHTHWGSGCRASLQGRKQVSPSLSLRNSSAKNGNNYAHLAHSVGRGMFIKCPVECYLPTMCLSEEIF